MTIFFSRVFIFKKEQRRRARYLGGTRISPGLSIAPQQVDKRLDLFGCDVFFQQLAVVVQQGSDCVFSQNFIPNLGLHD